MMPFLMFAQKLDSRIVSVANSSAYRDVGSSKLQAFSHSAASTAEV